jgi:hypothetical protein
MYFSTLLLMLHVLPISYSLTVSSPLVLQPHRPQMILSRDSVIIDVLWIGNWIYWTLTKRKGANESQKHVRTANTRKLRGNAARRNCLVLLPRSWVCLVVHELRCNRVAVSSVWAAQFNSMCSTQSDNISRELRFSEVAYVLGVASLLYSNFVHRILFSVRSLCSVSYGTPGDVSVVRRWPTLWRSIFLNFGLRLLLILLIFSIETDFPRLC